MHRFFLLLCLLSFFSCKKETITTYELAPIREPILTVNSSELTTELSWPSYDGDDFIAYHIYKREAIIVNGNVEYTSAYIATIDDPDKTSFVDSVQKGPLSISYTLYVQLDDDGTSLNSKEVTITPEGPYVMGSYQDALINTDRKLIYLIGSQQGAITLYSYEDQKVLLTDSLHIGIGYCALGDFNGTQNELYVPTNDGWLYILDAETLEKKDRIYVEGEQVYSVAATHGFLAVSNTDNSGYYGNNIKIYRRSDKTLTAITGASNRSRSIYLENTFASFVDISYNLLPTQLCSYELDAKGQVKKFQEDGYHGDYPLDPDVFCSFPDGRHFITSAQGAIYKSNLTFEKSLLSPYEYIQAYKHFAFNNEGSLIYAAALRKNQIDVFSYPDLVQQTSFSTKLKSFRIFRAGDFLLSISASEDYNTGGLNSYYFIEKINL